MTTILGILLVAALLHIAYLRTHWMPRFPKVKIYDCDTMEEIPEHSITKNTCTQ